MAKLHVLSVCTCTHTHRSDDFYFFFQDGVVLLHCNAGVSRSASIAIAYLMANEKIPFDDAFNRVKSVRPSVQPNAGFLVQLKEYQP